MSHKNISVLVGSLRKGSYNLMLAKTLMELAPANLKLRVLEIGHLSFYNEDLDNATPPKEWVAFRSEIEKSDGFIFISPEYNRSYAPALKNAIDIGSRPYGKNKFNGKPAAVLSSSIGAAGGFGANHHIRQVLTFINTPVMAQPEAYIGNAGQLFDENGKLKSEDTKAFLKQYIDSYATWAAKF